MLVRAAAWSAGVRIGLMSMTLSLDGGGVDRVVLGVRADEANVDGEELVFHDDDDAVPVAFDVEHHAVVREEAGGRVSGFDRVRSRPNGPLDLGKPSEEGLARVGVLVGKSLDGRAVEDAQRVNLARSQNGKKLREIGRQSVGAIGIEPTTPTVSR